MNEGIRFSFSAHVWQHRSLGGWFFVSLPALVAKEIRTHSGHFEEGWGRLKIAVHLGNSEWNTAIWFDSKHDTYLLPLKKEIRNKENISAESEVKVTLWL